MKWKDTVDWDDHLPSTNEYLKEFIRMDKDPIPGWTVAAKTQSSGRGRADHTFFSPLGGLYASTWIPDEALKIPPELLTVAVAAALCRAIEDCFAIIPSVKWVNDLYDGGKKVAGILCEHGNGYIIGVGVNVFPPVREEEWPEELRNIAGSLLDHRDFDAPDRLLRCYLDKLEEVVTEKPEKILREYRKHLFLIGKTVTVEGRYAEVLGIDDRAGLMIRYVDTGEEKTLVAGEVSVRPQSFPKKKRWYLKDDDQQNPTSEDSDPF